MVYILRNDTNLRAPQSTQVLSTPYGNYGTSSDVPRLHVRLLSIAFPIETGVRCSFWWVTAAPDVIGRETIEAGLLTSPRDIFPFLYQGKRAAAAVWVSRRHARQGTYCSSLSLSSSLSSHPLHPMTSSYGTEPFTQTGQFRPATLQPGPTGPYQNPNYAQSSAQSNFIDAPPPSQHQPASRPHSIAELAEIAKQSLGDDPRPFKTWLRIAENARRDAKAFKEQGSLELAFVEYAKAATIVLEKIPFHPEYRVLLSTTQRHNMGLVSYIRPMIP